MLKYWVWLSTLEGLGNLGKRRVLEYFGSPKAAMFADGEEYARVPGLREAERMALRDKNLARAEEILDECSDLGIQILTYTDASYPERLQQLEDAPLLLYWKGRLPAFDHLPVIGVVGTRKATAYGLQTARRMGYQLGQSGGVVVSGMAKGIDAMATEGCLSAGQLAVGVLGGGVDVVYPKVNRSLFRDMEERGCLMSEYPPGTPPLGAHFPVRNRIISGLSLGVLVVEAPQRSGSLITASLANEQGRDVFAVPGTIDTAAFIGSNGLIQEGAKLVTTGWDILSEYEHLFPNLRPATLGTKTGPPMKEQTAAAKAKAAEKRPEESAGKAIEGRTKKTQPAAVSDKKGIDNPKNKPYSDLESVMAELSADERAIAFYLLEGPKQADELSIATGLPASRVLAAMTMLQVRGLAEQRAGKVLALTVGDAKQTN